MSKDKRVNLIKDFVLMIAILNIVGFIFYKLGFLSSFSFPYIINLGVMYYGYVESMARVPAV